MKTVKKMIEELQKFPVDAGCYGYEGEATGLGIKTKEGKYGFIFSSESERIDEKEDNVATEYLKD